MNHDRSETTRRPRPCLPLFLVAILSTTPAIADFIRGDSNGDALLNCADPVHTLAYLFSGEPLHCFDAADSNDDGQVDIADPITTLTYLFLGGTPLPSPFPDCGIDPTEDNIGCAMPPPPCTSQPLHITSDPITLANVSSLYQYQLHTEGGTIPVEYTLLVGHPGASLGSTGLLQWIPPVESAGVHLFRVRASSATSVDEQEFIVTVNPWPDAPAITSTVPTTTATLQVLLFGNAPGATIVEFTNDNVVTSTLVTPSSEFLHVVDLLPNKKNLVHIRALSALGQASAPTTVVIVQDSQPPEVFVDNPLHGSTTFAESVDLFGRVSDMLSGFMGLVVTYSVDAGPLQFASINEGIGTNGTFFAAEIPLSIGDHTITITAQDATGNAAITHADFQRLPLDPTRPTLTLASGNGQSAMVNSELNQPVTVLVTDAMGAPFANKLVTFRVTRSDGRLRQPGASNDTGALVYQTFTDATGQASAAWRLGSDSGVGNQRVRVTSEGVQNDLLVCASATPGAPVQVNIGAGNNQRGEAGMPAECKLCAWASDGCNGVGGVAVTFTVTTGNGTVNGQAQVTVPTDSTGHAEVEFSFGTSGGLNTVHATTDSNQGSPAVFTLESYTRDLLAVTAFSGLVLSNSGQPIEGATCAIKLPGHPPLVEVTTADGRFRFHSLPGAGPAEFTVDGHTATSVGARPVAPGTFPFLHYEPILVPNAHNSLPMPVLLPALNPNNWRSYSTAVPTVLTVQHIDGLRMTVAPGSMTLSSGEPAPDGTPIALNIVHHDDVPMPLPDGAAPPFAWTLQPAGATFDPPVTIEYPNMSGLPPGAVANFLTFNHDTGRFEIFSTGTVSENAATIVTDARDGLSLAGWGCNCPPYAITSSCEGSCAELVTPNGCGATWNVHLVPDYWRSPTCQSLVDFSLACNSHDCCYVTCGASRDECDDAFLATLGAACDSAYPIILSPLCNLDCRKAASVYFAFVRQFGESWWSNGQARALSCECQECDPQPANGGPQFGMPGGPLLYLDADFDTLPDEWELLVGLPTNYANTFGDYDDDGLANIAEFLLNTDPFLADTDGDGRSDDLEAGDLQVLLDPHLDATWTVTVNGQAVRADERGTFVLSNISAADTSPPDFISDDVMRVVATSSARPSTRYAFSEPFQFQGAQPYIVGSLTYTDEAPPLPESIRFAPADPLLVELESPVPLNLVALLGDGTEIDASATTSWTTYRVSNPSLLTVDSQGVLVAQSTGTAFVTATNEGATAVRRVTVFEELVQVSIVGFVFLPDGTRAQDAAVTTPWGSTTTTGTDGSFEIDVTVPSVLRHLLVQATHAANGEQLSAARRVDLFRSGISDAGIIVLRTDAGTLFPGAMFSLGRFPVDLTTADFNADGHPDISSANSVDNTIEVLLGDGAGGFTSFQVLDLPPGAPTSITSAHVNVDSHVDIVLTTILDDVGSAIVVLLADGVGGFLAPITRLLPAPVFDVPIAITKIDINADGAIDFAVARGSSVLLAFGDGTGSLLDTQTLSAGATALMDITAADLNGDGHSDLATANSGSNSISILLSDSQGGFLPPVVIPDPLPGFLGASSIVALIAIDIDNDGDLDIASANLGSSALSTFRNDSLGGFVASATISLDAAPTSIGAADLDGDGALEVLSTTVATVSLSDGDNTMALSLAVVPLTPNGDFGVSYYSAIGGDPLELDDRLSAIVVADFDSNGMPDVAATNPRARTLTLLRSSSDGALHPLQLPLPDLPVSLTLSDFNGDGADDIATAIPELASILVLLSTGSGEFSLPQQYPVATSSPSSSLAALGGLFPLNGLTAADLDADGAVDLAALGFAGDAISVLWGDGLGGFSSALTIPLAGAPQPLVGCVCPESIIAVDLNNDGRSDLVTANLYAGVSVVLSNDSGGFLSPVHYNTGTSMRAVLAGDVDGDSSTDLVAMSGESVLIMSGNGAGGFSTVQSIPISISASSLTMADFTGDTFMDLAIVGEGDGSSELFLMVGDGSGGFSLYSSQALDDRALRVSSVDVNGDGAIDLVTTSMHDHQVSIHLGDLAGGWSQPLRFATRPVPVVTAFGDCDADGHIDLCTANFGGVSLTVLFGVSD